MAASSMAMSAAAQTDITLPKPSEQGGLTIMEALWARHSDREFSSQPLSEQDLSDLLFAASGINRAESGKLTSPSALNTQEIDVYLITTEGAYLYEPQGHALKLVAEGDHRALLAGTPQFSQDFVLQAPCCLLLVANPQKFERKSDNNLLMAVADAGIVSENVCLFCAGRCLSTVPRATMDSQALSALLSLPAESLPILNLPVGYPKP